MDASSDRRRFLTIEDIFEESGDEDEGTIFYTAFTNILESIIAPIFAEVYPQLEDVTTSNIRPKDNNVLEFSVTGYQDAMYNKLNKPIELGDMMKEFAEKQQQILNGVRWAIYPTMRGSLLEQYGLSEEQFLVKTVAVEVNPRLFSYYSESGIRERHRYLGEVYFSVAVIFSLVIEDISTMEPEGEEAVRLRLESLCSPTSRYPLQELRDWARQLGSGDREGAMTRADLCAFVRKQL